MNRVLNFFNSVKENKIHDVIYNQGNSNDKSPGWRDYVLKSLLIIGVVSGLSSNNIANAESFLNNNSINIQDQSVLREFNHSKQDYLSAGNDLVRDFYIKGALSQKYKINIVNINSNATEATAIPGLTCQVNWGLDNNGLTQSLINGVDIKQTPLYKKMALLHELSHCELLKIENPFRNSGLKIISEKWINEWVVGGVIPKNTINVFFAENFADTYGAIMLLKSEDFSEESISEVKRWYEIRKIKREMDERKGFSLTTDPHYTDFSLKQVIENMDRIRNSTSPEYKDLALSIASKSVLEWLNSNRTLENLNEDVSSPEIDNSRQRIVGTEGIDEILTGFEDGQFFESAIVGQIQLLLAERQNLITTPKVFSVNGDNNSREIAKSILSVMDENNNSSRISVKLNKKEGSLKWNFTNKKVALFYMNNILNILDSIDAVNEWKNNNNWSLVKKDITTVLSKNIKYKNNDVPNVNMLSDKLTEKLKNKPFSSDEVINKKCSYKNGNYW